MKNTVITTEALSNGEFIFNTNYMLEGETVEFDTESVRKVLEISPIKPKEVYGNNNKLEIIYNIDYNKDKNKYELKMYLKDSKGSELMESEDIELYEMLEMILDSYNNSSYLTSHELLLEKISKLDINLNEKLLNEGLFPKSKFMLEGKGIVKTNSNKEVLGTFSRILINSEIDEAILCEYIGSVPNNVDCDVVIETNIGLSVTIPNILFKGKTGEILELKYVSMSSDSATFNIAKDCILTKLEDKVETNLEINVLSSAGICSTLYTKAIDDAIQYINEHNDSDKIMSYIVKQKDALYENAAVNDIEAIADDLFDDLDF